MTKPSHLSRNLRIMDRMTSWYLHFTYRAAPLLPKHLTALELTLMFQLSDREHRLVAHFTQVLQHAHGA